MENMNLHTQGITKLFSSETHVNEGRKTHFGEMKTSKHGKKLLPAAVCVVVAQLYLRWLLMKFKCELVVECF